MARKKNASCILCHLEGTHYTNTVVILSGSPMRFFAALLRIAFSVNLSIADVGTTMIAQNPL